MAQLRLAPHSVDKHLVAAGIAISRAKQALERIPEADVPPERLERLRALRGLLQSMHDQTIHEVRTGIRRSGKTKRPTTLADVEDVDSYVAEFVDPAENI